jgi:hypothetical protein
MSEEVKFKTLKEEKKSAFDELQSLKKDIEELKKEKDVLVNILKSFKEDLDTEKKEIFDDIEDSHSKINNYYNQLFNDSKDANGNLIQSIRSKIQEISTLAEDVEGKINSAEGVIDDFDGEVFKNFYNKIEERDEKYNQYEHKLKNLQIETEKQQKINSNIQSDSQRFLQDITDKTLINTFKEQAIEKKESYKWLFILSIVMACFIGLVGFGLIWKEKPIGIQWLVLLPFVFAYFSLAKQADINKKLAEEYQHKASLTEYLAGYKKMWELGRSDEEYIKLIEEIKTEILKNPSYCIKIGKDYPDNIKSVAKDIAYTVSKVSPFNKTSE